MNLHNSMSDHDGDRNTESSKAIMKVWEYNNLWGCFNNTNDEVNSSELAMRLESYIFSQGYSLYFFSHFCSFAAKSKIINQFTIKFNLLPKQPSHAYSMLKIDEWDVSKWVLHPVSSHNATDKTPMHEMPLW